MIYAHMTDGGILIGLSARNLELLKEGRPIFKRIPGAPTLLIVYGETEQHILADLKKQGLELPAENTWNKIPT